MLASSSEVTNSGREPMEHYKYLIIGGGMTADSAVRGIRELDDGNSVGLLSNEAIGPYDRPPLSKGLWKGKDPESIWRRTAEVPGVSLHLGKTAARIDVAARQVVDREGGTYSYEKLLLATGGTPRRLPFGEGSIIYYRTVEDYQRLRALAQEKEQFAVIGGGFIGSEIAAALAMNGKRVVMVFPEIGIGALAYPADLSRAITQLYREKGVEVLTNASVQGLERNQNKLSLQL